MSQKLAHFEVISAQRSFAGGVCGLVNIKTIKTIITKIKTC